MNSEKKELGPGLKFVNGLKTFEITLLVVLFTIMFVVGCAQIVSRYVFNNPIAWTDEMSGMLEMVVTFLALGYCVRTKSNIAVTGILDRMPPTAKHIVVIITNIVCVFALIMVISVSSKYSNMQWNVHYGTFMISRGLTYLAAPIGCVLACINFTLDTIDQVRMLSGRNAIFNFQKEEVKEKEGAVEGEEV